MRVVKVQLTNATKLLMNESVVGPLHSSSLNTGILNQGKIVEDGPLSPFLSLLLDTYKEERELPTLSFPRNIR